MKSLRQIFSKISKKQEKASSTELTEEDRGTQLAALMNSGRTKLRSNQYNQAVVDFGKVIELVPLYGIAYFDRGTALHLNGDNQEALRDFDIAIALLPDTTMERVVAYHNRGLVNEDLGNIGETIRNLEIAHEAGFPSSATELDRIRMKYNENDITIDEVPALESICNEARNVYNSNPLISLVLFCKAIEFYPNAVEATYGKGLANVALSRIDEAIKDFSVTIALDPPPGLLAEALYNRGSLLKSKGEYKLAVDDLERSLNLAQDKSVNFPVLGDSKKEEAMIQGMVANLEQTKESLKMHNK